MLIALFMIVSFALPGLLVVKWGGDQGLTCVAELSSWLINAFNGEWLRIDNPVPKTQIDGKPRER
jgi:hypothetical protein